MKTEYKAFWTLRWVTLFISLGAATAGASTIPVASVEEREQVLETAERHLSDPDPERLERIKAAWNPFVRVPEQVVEAKEAGLDPSEAAAREVAPAQLGDEAILRGVISRIEPWGSMRRGEHWVILLERGRLVAGMEFKVRLQEREYPVAVEAVSENEYTLRLNDTRVVQKITQKDAGGTAYFDQRD